ncbi:unnamed protein product [Periconia digitata]|uniref:Velvet domain-containing protein n=1 Tax=Periconia digitata TaxID=1303443 RepID=A0A9W4UN67_9PLEO|nr:unnamed protein product [Periconia digitata]
MQNARRRGKISGSRSISKDIALDMILKPPPFPWAERFEAGEDWIGRMQVVALDLAHCPDGSRALPCVHLNEWMFGCRLALRLVWSGAGRFFRCIAPDLAGDWPILPILHRRLEASSPNKQRQTSMDPGSGCGRWRWWGQRLARSRWKSSWPTSIHPLNDHDHHRYHHHQHHHQHQGWTAVHGNQIPGARRQGTHSEPISLDKRSRDSQASFPHYSLSWLTCPQSVVRVRCPPRFEQSSVRAGKWTRPMWHRLPRAHIVQCAASPSFAARQARSPPIVHNVVPSLLPLSSFHALSFPGPLSTPASLISSRIALPTPWPPSQTHLADLCPPNSASCSTREQINYRMPQQHQHHQHHPNAPSSLLPFRPSPDMTDTQKLPALSPYFDHSRRLPPIKIPPDTSPSVPPPPPPHVDYSFHHQLPSIQSGLPPRHHPQQPHNHHQPSAPSSLPRPSAPSVDKILHHQSNPIPYTPPRSDPPYSPQQYGPPISPRTEFEHRSQRLTEQRYPYEDSRPTPHQPSRHEQPYASLTSPVEQPQPRPYAPHQSPSYPSAYASNSTPFHGSVGSHRGSISHSLGPIAYSEPPTAGPPPRQIPRPGSIPQPVYNDQLKLNYELRVRQQPIAARACGFGERDRRVIDPPPIIQLIVTDPKTGAAEQEELRYSLNVVHCTLWNAKGTSEETALIQPDRRTTRRLMGQLVASPSVAKDEHDVEGCFFCFPDLSCRTHGMYRLRFVLMRLDPMNLHVGGFSPILNEVLSDVFTVYTAKDFPGMRPSSALTRALKLQGCNIQVKKGNEKALARKRLTQSQDHDNHEDDDEMGKRRRKD